jgi:hypothetical protein
MKKVTLFLIDFLINVWNFFLQFEGSVAHTVSLRSHTVEGTIRISIPHHSERGECRQALIIIS